MTSSREKDGDLVLLDACCLINLFATGRVEEILDSLPHRFAVARYVVEEEVLEIAGEEERVSLHPLLAELVGKGVLEKLDIESEEEEAELVRFAAELDDGEAHTCALAIVRRALVATDDKKAIRVFRSAWEGHGREEEPVLRTSEPLFTWARARELEEPVIGRIVRAIARRASFFPPRNDPHFERWMALLEVEE
jgi:predicted nucleic acid-binding protein